MGRHSGRNLMEDTPVLVLNASDEPIRITAARRAMTLIVKVEAGPPEGSPIKEHRRAPGGFGFSLAWQDLPGKTNQGFQGHAPPFT